MKRIPLVAALVLAAMVPASHADAETVGTLTLDSLSFVSFQDEQVVPIPSGSTIRFHFGAPRVDGSVPFTIAPGDVSIPEIPLSGDQTLRYGLASTASGHLRPSVAGRIVELNASVTATLTKGGVEGTLTYAVPFTTESVTATNGSHTVQVTGVRIVPAARYTQIVGATVNKPNAIPKPGTAVYTVLSGQFDQLP